MGDQSNVKFRLNNAELWGGLIGLALAGFVTWSGLKLKLGTINDPGSGYVLFYTGILMCLFSSAIIIAALTEGGPTFGSRWRDARWTKPVIVIAGQRTILLTPDREFDLGVVGPDQRIVRELEGTRIVNASVVEARQLKSGQT